MIFLKKDSGQISHSLVFQGVIKAWHYHKTQTQWNYVVNGLIKVVLHDIRDESPTFRETNWNCCRSIITDSKIYSSPPGVAHGYKCLNGPMNIIYITSGIYDPADEGRLEYDHKSINYNWLDLKIK